MSVNETDKARKIEQGRKKDEPKSETGKHQVKVYIIQERMRSALSLPLDVP